MAVDPDAVEPFATPSCAGVSVAAATDDLGSLWHVDDPDEWPSLEEVKASTVRRVLRGTVGNRNVHIKLFRAARLSDRARDAVGGSRAGREFEQLRRARAAGLPAVRPLAAGTFRGSFGARSFLVTETVAGGEPLPDHPWSAALSDATGQLLRRAHDLGLHAPDLHRGNMIWDGTALWLVDLTGAHLAQPVEDADRARALAFFFQHLDGGSAAPEAAPVWRAYLGAAEAERGETLRAAGRQASRRIRARALLSFGRRAFRACRHTEEGPRPGRKGRLFLHRPAAALHEEAQALLEAPENAQVIKRGRRGGVFCTDSLIAKTRTAAHARKLFRASYWLLFAGVPTPRPVALRIHDRRGAVALERLPEANLLERWRRSAPLPPDDLRAIARSLGNAIGRLHAHGLRNRDLKLDNLIWHGGQVHLVDLDGVRRKLPHDGRGVGHDLGRLSAAWTAEGQPGGSPTARTFLRAYARARRDLLARPLTPHDLRTATDRAKAWATAHG